MSFTCTVQTLFVRHWDWQVWHVACRAGQCSHPWSGDLLHRVHIVWAASTFGGRLENRDWPFFFESYFFPDLPWLGGQHRHLVGCRLLPPTVAIAQTPSDVLWKLLFEERDLHPFAASLTVQHHGAPPPACPESFDDAKPHSHSALPGCIER